MNMIECWVIKVIKIRYLADQLQVPTWAVKCLVEDESGCPPYEHTLYFDNEAEAHFVSKGYLFRG